MAATRPFRFGVNLLEIGGRERWLATCLRAEHLGYDVILVPDHLGMPAPFPSLVAAAGVTTTPRLGTFVLNAAFYNPTLLAREVAATNELVQGRLELGIGTGYVKEEFDVAGLPYGSGRERIDHLEITLERLRELLPALGGRTDHPETPLLLGGNGDRMLRLAARTADIVGLTGVSSDAEGRLSLIGASALDERIGLAADAAGNRIDEIEWNVLCQTVEITDDREATGERLRRQFAPHVTHDEFDPLPTVLFGTPEEIVGSLHRARERYGVSYVTVLEPALEPFAQVIAALRA